MLALLRTAANCNGTATHIFKRRCRMAQSIVENVTRRLLYADVPRAHATLAEPLCRNRIRALVLLPRAYFDRPSKLLAQPCFFKCRTNHQRFALARDQ